MKTIFDKINPKYLECTAGSCEHISHSLNPIIIITLVSLIIVAYRSCKENKA